MYRKLSQVFLIYYINSMYKSAYNNCFRIVLHCMLLYTFIFPRIFTDIYSKAMHLKLHTTSEEHRTQLLLKALKNKDVDTITQLVSHPSHPVNVNRPNKYNKLPIFKAVSMGTLQIVQLLLYKSVIKLNLDVERYVHDVLCTPLLLAVRLGDEAIVQELCNAGADVNMWTVRRTDVTVITPIMEAVVQHNMAICKILLKTNAHVNFVAKNTALNTALLLAAGIPNANFPGVSESIAQVLLKHGATLQPMWKKTPMLQACMCNNGNTVDLFMRSGYKFNVHEISEPDELQVAIGTKSTSSAVVLLKWGFLYQKGINGEPYFRMAANQCLYGLMHLMIELNPSCLQEPWLRQLTSHETVLTEDETSAKTEEETPKESKETKSFFDWLEETKKNPLPLKELCKAFIRHQLVKHATDHQCHIPSLIRQLPLHSFTKNTLKLTNTNDAFKDIMNQRRNVL